MRRAILLFLLVATLCPFALLAQQHPNVARGFEAEKLYQFLDLDSVSLYNRNLNISIPIGLQYANDGGMTYGLTLTYNSKLWDFQTEEIEGDPTRVQTYALPVPSRASNAGFGWSVSLGRLISPDDPQNDYNPMDGEPPMPACEIGGPDYCHQAWIYESPDGAQHVMEHRFATGTADDPDVYYSHDGSHLRMIRSGATMLVSFPDGSVHEYTKREPLQRGGWRLVSMRDVHQNLLTVSYPTVPQRRWVLTDKFGRTLVVQFRETGNAQENYKYIIDKILFRAPGDGDTAPTLTYTFEYDLRDPNPEDEGITAGVKVDRVCISPRMNRQYGTVRVPRLKRISLPVVDDNAAATGYEFTYGEFSTCQAGLLKSMTLPTGGQIRWSWLVDAEMAVAGCNTKTFQRSPVVVRRELDDGTGQVAAWNYTSALEGSCQQKTCLGNESCPEGEDPPENVCDIFYAYSQQRTTVTSPIGDKTEYFFWTDNKAMNLTECPLNPIEIDMGMPLSALDISSESSGKWHASSIAYDCDGSNCVPVRKTYLRYESTLVAIPEQTRRILANWRMSGQRTLYLDDLDGSGNPHRTETTHSDWDGYGHFRRTIEGGSFGPTRESFTDFNPGTDANGLIGGVPKFTKSMPWVLGTYASKLALDNATADKAKTLACFEASTGFLEASRVIRSKSGTAAAGDLISRFTRDANGNVVREHSALASGSSETCSSWMNPTTLQYDVEHLYSRGVRTESRFHSVVGRPPLASSPFPFHRASLDPATGLPLESLDPAGNETRFTYDPLGRLKSVAYGCPSPSGACENGTARYQYFGLGGTTSEPKPRVVTQRLSRNAEVLSERAFLFDPLGRVWEERTTTADGIAIQRKAYGLDGNLVSVSEPGYGAPGALTTFTYDIFGRPLTTRPPDAQATDSPKVIRQAYKGVRQTTRTVGIGRAGGILPTSTVERFDHFGRLVAVEDLSGDGGTPATTNYRYDVGGRIAGVEMGVQTRTFEYDAAGFLLSESHPEMAITTYSGYDARGHAASKKIGTGTGAKTLTFAYDAAERLRKVEDSSHRVLQSFEYDALDGQSMTPGNLGRLLRATRNNYFDAPGTLLFKVEDSFVYDRSGRVASKSTKVTDPDGVAETFAQAAAYDDADAPVSLTYPTCALCGSHGGIGTLGYAYSQGRLSSVNGFTAQSGIIYRANGLPAQIQRINGSGDEIARETYGEDPYGMARYQSLTVSNIKDCSTITSHPADANILASQTATFTIAVASTTGNVTYKWYAGKSGDTSGGVLGTANSFTTPALTVTTSFWCLVSEDNGSCSRASNTATAFVCEPPSVLLPKDGEPTPSRTVPQGSNVQVTVVAQGTSVRYTWFKRVGTTLTALPDRTNQSSFVYAASAPEADVTFVVKLEGACGQAVEVDVLTLTVTEAEPECEMPELDAAMPDLMIASSPLETLDLSVRLPEDGRSYGYRWYRNGELYSTGTVTTQIPVPGQPLVATYIPMSASIATYDLFELEAWMVCAGAQSPHFRGSMFAYLAGTCALPPVTVDQTSIVIAPGDTTQNRTFTAHCIRPDVEYQWYAGESGDTRRPIASNPGSANKLTVSPQPATYWVRVVNECGMATNSETLMVSLSNCSPVRFVAQPQSVSTQAGATHTLRADVASRPAVTSYAWFQGEDDSLQVGSASTLTVNPMQTTTYWLRAGNGCHNGDSAYARISVTSCADITVTAQPSDASIQSGATVTLAIAATASEALTYQWYEGESGDTSRPVAGATSASVTLQPSSTSRYWVRVGFARAGMCAIDSRTITAAVCRTPVVTQGPFDSGSSIPNAPEWLQVAATGDRLSYQWYEGELGSTTTPVGAARNAIKVSSAVTKKFWVRITSDCVAPSQDAVRDAGPVFFSIPPAITAHPQDTKVVPGTSTTLSVTASGTFLRYEWYAGPSGNTTSGVLGTGATFVTPQLQQAATYWVRVYSGNAGRNSDAATVSICTGPVVSWDDVIYDVHQGESQTLAVSLLSLVDVKLYWYEGNSGDVAGSTLLAGPTQNPTLSITSTQTRSYWVRAVLGTCYADTATATIRVCLPTITTQPQSGILVTTGNPQATKRLSVAATGGTLTHQWFVGQQGDVTTPVSGGTGSFIDVSPTTTTTYWVRVTGSCSASVDSDAATVTVCQAPVITQQPQSAVTSGGAATIGVTVTGTSLNYQWYRGASGTTTTPVGNNSAVLELTGLLQSAQYWVRITGLCGSIDSSAAMVSVAPTITTHPASIAITRATSTTLSVVAAGTHLGYQWSQCTGDSVEMIPGAIESTYATPALVDDSEYEVRVFSGHASVVSNPAIVSICQPKTVSIVQPSQVSGSMVTLSVLSIPGESYTWYQGPSGTTTTPVGTGSTFTPSPTVTTSYWVRMTTATCTSDSATKTIVICQPAVTSQPQDANIAAGESHTLSVAATGNPPLQVQWYTGAPGPTESLIAGATSSTYVATPSATTTYWAKIATGSGCATNSNVATVSVCNPATITQEPANVSVARGSSVTIGVNATGNDLHYQWYLGTAGNTSTPVGLDQNTYTFTANSTASYWVRVSGSCLGRHDDSVAALVSVYPIITTQPADVSICSGGSTTVTIAATASPVTYTWYNGTTQIGTGASLTLTNMTATTNVFCKVASGNAEVTSRTAIVTAQPRPTFSSTILKTDLGGGCYRVTAGVVQQDVGKVTFRWYRGAIGNTTQTVSTTNVFDACPTQATDYWVRVTYTATGCSSDRAYTLTP